MRDISQTVRPILSATDSPTERISAFVDHFLRPQVEKIKSYVKHTTHFLNIIKNLRDLPEESLLVTLDVSSLYTNIDNEEGILACAKIPNKEKEAGELPKKQLPWGYFEVGSNQEQFQIQQQTLPTNRWDNNGHQYGGYLV